MPPRDLLPEEHVYRDKGCSIHGACLTCPLSRCRYERPPKAALLDVAALQMLTLVESGMEIAAAARQLGRSPRTGYRQVQHLRDVGLMYKPATTSSAQE